MKQISANDLYDDIYEASHRLENNSRDKYNLILNQEAIDMLNGLNFIGHVDLKHFPTEFCGYVCDRDVSQSCLFKFEEKLMTN